MADKVQFILDRMAPMFRQLVQNEIFTSDEVQKVIKKRTDHEYVLRRRQLTIADFYNYLQYEINLDKLRILRCQRIGLNNLKDKKSEMRQLNTSFLRHINYIFERAIRRFPKELSLWSDYISFLKTKNATTILSTVFGRLLSLFPKNEDLWLQAAIHELEINNNAHATRILLQRSLRVNKTSQKLWLKYFEMELWYLLRNDTRKNILGLESSISTKESFMNSPPIIVFKHAILAINNPEFAYQLHDSCISISYELAVLIEEHLYSNYSHLDSYWTYICESRVQNILKDYIPSNIQNKKNSNKRLRELSPQDTLEVIITSMNTCVDTINNAISHLQKEDSVEVSVEESSSSAHTSNNNEIKIETIIQIKLNTRNQILIKSLRKSLDIIIESITKMNLHDIFNNNNNQQILDDTIFFQPGQSVRFMDLIDNIYELLNTLHSTHENSSSTSTSSLSCENSANNLSSILEIIQMIYKYSALLISIDLGEEILNHAIDIAINISSSYTSLSSTSTLASTSTSNSTITNNNDSLQTRSVWCLKYVRVSMIISTEDMKDSIATSTTTNTTSTTKSKSSMKSAKATATSTSTSVPVFMNLTDVHTACDWIQEILTSYPHLKIDLDLEELFEFVLKLEIHNIHLIASADAISSSSSLPFGLVTQIDSKEKNSSLSSKSAIITAKRIVDWAVVACPTVGKFWIQLEEIERLLGDHKAANHSRWRRDQLTGSMG
eukprot:gene4205-8365_t